jgi:glutathione peroxidase
MRVIRRREAMLAAGGLLPWAGWADAAATPGCPALLRHVVPRLQDEQPIDLCRFAGRVLLVVNTASQCGYTPQYRGLEALHARFEPRGLTVLGFPSNDFGGQEPGDHREIAAFCENQFGVRFPMFAKTVVRAGAGQHPLFAALAAAGGGPPRWNFHKYLVARDGRAVRGWASDVAPQDPALIRELERLLGSK